LLGFLFEVVFLDGKLEEADYALLAGFGTDVVGDGVPVFAVELQSFKEEEGFLVGPHGFTVDGAVGRVFHLGEFSAFHLAVFSVGVGLRESSLEVTVGAEVDLLALTTTAVVSYTGTVDSAGEAVVDTLLESFIFLGVAVGGGDLVAQGVVDVLAELEVGVELGGGSAAGGALGDGVGLAGSGYCTGRRLEGLESAGSIGGDAEVASVGRADVGGSGFGVNLVMLARNPERIIGHLPGS
jgi:hypothetical protein